MKALAFSPAALTDMDVIWDYSALHWGPNQADAYIDDIVQACHGLATGQKMGAIAHIRRGYLKLSVGAHMIYFQDRGDRLDIIRILHGRQDVDRHL